MPVNKKNGLNGKAKSDKDRDALFILGDHRPIYILLYLYLVYSCNFMSQQITNPGVLLLIRNSSEKNIEFIDGLIVHPLKMYLQCML